MSIYKRKSIEFKGYKTEICDYENNQLGLKGWELEAIVQAQNADVVKYMYRKLKWWAAFLR